MDDSELNEIVKLAGGPNFDPFKKQRKDAEKERKANDFGFSPFLIKRASAKQPTRQTQRPLFGDLWRTGDLALLVGEPGVGKSLLATQIAEVIARGAEHSINGMPAPPKPQRVIYFDFERTQAQFSELYSCQPYPQTPYREEYKFSSRFDIARLDDLSTIPDAFKGRVDGYIRHWVYDVILTGEAKIVIIDNISHVAIGTTIEKIMRALRVASAESGSSVLVVAHAKPKRRPSAFTLADITRCRSLREIPDSIFAIARSTAHPDIRYVKDLKSHTTPLTSDIAAAVMSAPGFTPSSAVLTYRLERLVSPISNLKSQIENPEITDRDSSALRIPHSAFLGLNYLGLSLESKHLPPPRVSPRVSSPHVSKGSSRLPSATEALAQGIIDGSYAKYLLGE
jgi:hypothetical protein